MSNDNILEPIFDVFWNAGCTIYKWIKGEQKTFDFNKFFKDIELKNKKDIYPTVYKKFETDLGMKYLITIPPGMELKNFLAIQGAMEQQARKHMDIEYKNGFIQIEVIERELDKNYNYSLPIKIEDYIKIPIGESLHGTEYINLKEVPNCLITGTTGSGKSVCSKAILTSLVNMYTPEELHLYLVDFKQVELASFRNLGHTKVFEREVEPAKEVISTLMEECKARYDEFFKHNLTNIYDYNKKFPNKKMPFQVLFIEEFVMLQEDKSKIAMSMLRKFASLCRASGQYIFISCQRADNTVIDGVLKANVGNRICFRMEDSKNSIIALDSEGAEELEGRGHGILKVGANKTEFRSYYITDKQVNQYTKKHIRKPSKQLQEQKQHKAILKQNKPNTREFKKESSEYKKNTDKIENWDFLDKL
ncbi:FtsK/SpoIIIE domain-containing protein [Paraclostridium sordellii]|uniref:FtsK/SpoIIIE domain-containing protein n=1 Tax=Paraclostridium sordellii TaxID=1505 RepID=UPI0005E51470|nr:FtsK/SpoIIIE domain-containing protein [Paeniclostridium sordellii]CEP82661.1 FtsK/SpoIIIE family protein [[Clostridium] sordellii] [Paeniclostridium sordellii]